MYLERLDENAFKIAENKINNDVDIITLQWKLSNTEKHRPNSAIPKSMDQIPL